MSRSGDGLTGREQQRRTSRAVGGTMMFSVGSTVATKLGGPLMMVREFSPTKDGTQYLCFWFDESMSYCSEWFDEQLLLESDGARKAGFSP